jgi:anaphase-promoting complex subunit 1
MANNYESNFTTRNEAVASGIALPDTHFLLDYSRPDTLMLKVLARSLILWDQVEPTSRWMDNQIPLVVRRTYLKMTKIAKKSTETVLSVLDQETTQENPGSNQSNNGPLGTEGEEERESLPADFQGEFDVDRQSVRQIHAYIIAGSCFSIGLRFAGTADAQAAKIITEKLLEFKAFRDSNDPLPAALRPEQPVVGMCLGMCAISLALVMAGTGDLESLRLFKAIRWRSDGGIRHGAHMTVASAIGLLFVGGGLCTVGRSPADVAALVAAFFPRFPMNTTDNKYHLQALRHIYALAVQQRHVQAFDVDSKEGISVLVEVSLSLCITLSLKMCGTHPYFQAQSQESREKATLLTTPNLLTNVDSKRVSLAVKSDIYFPTTVSIDDSNTGGFCIYLKKRKDVGDEAKPRNMYLDFATGKSHSQKLVGLLQNCQTRSRTNCRCSESAKPFCASNLLGCVSVPLSPDALPVSSLLGSLQSSSMHSLSSDILILQYYYQRFGYAPEAHYFLAPDNAALIIEKLRQIVLSCPPWAPYLSAEEDTACMDISS